MSLLLALRSLLKFIIFIDGMLFLRYTCDYLSESRAVIHLENNIKKLILHNW
jgi:hypothetical protein